MRLNFFVDEFYASFSLRRHVVANPTGGDWRVKLKIVGKMAGMFFWKCRKWSWMDYRNKSIGCPKNKSVRGVEQDLKRGAYMITQK